LWTYIGISYIFRRNRPVSFRSYQDYNYGLTFEGVVPLYNPYSEDMLGFGINFRNFSQGPLAYNVEYFDVTLDTRVLPRFKPATSRLILARGAARQNRQGPFRASDLAHYKDRTVTGEIDFAVSYGPPVGIPVRLLKMRIEITININSNGNVGFGDNIVNESDEPYYDPKLLRHSNW
jgi:hypothetical protein